MPSAPSVEADAAAWKSKRRSIEGGSPVDHSEGKEDSDGWSIDGSVSLHEQDESDKRLDACSGSVGLPSLPDSVLLSLAQAPRRPRRWLARRRSELHMAWENRLLSYDEIPGWMRDNSLIQGQYRPQMTAWQATKSLFSWHNETFNAWSHLIGERERCSSICDITLPRLLPPDIQASCS